VVPETAPPAPRCSPEAIVPRGLTFPAGQISKDLTCRFLSFKLIHESKHWYHITVLTDVAIELIIRYFIINKVEKIE
jgi:hypothetical protein